MSHAEGCISRSCLGCGPDSEMNKLKDKLRVEVENNIALLEELKRVKEELADCRKLLTTRDGELRSPK